jgi:SAM-dependent methyltransferase
VDVVFGIAILHHLDLDLAAREVRRVLKKGGRAIFQEPVRNSKFVRRIHSLIPYHARFPSRPLIDVELHKHSPPAGAITVAHSLPYVSVAHYPVARDHPSALRPHRAILNVPRVAHYGGIRVVEMTK